MENKIRTGIIGYGLSGRVFHAPFVDVVEGLELSKISTSDPKKISLAKERYPYATIVSDAKDIVQDPEIDLVIVTSPNTVHFHWAKEALLANKHVVVEKPFTVNYAEAQELVELSKQKNKILSVYHNRRFTSDTRTVKKILDSAPASVMAAAAAEPRTSQRRHGRGGPAMPLAFFALAGTGSASRGAVKAASTANSSMTSGNTMDTRMETTACVR